jgi:hypothetical protein
MTDLREETLIRKGFWYFILPSIILGLIACFVPEVYMLLPVHETDTCLCSFGSQESLLANYFGVFKLTSILSFLVFNWSILMVLLVKIFRIRNINDETLIKKECSLIVGVWTFFSILQYALFLYMQNVICEPT